MKTLLHSGYHDYSAVWEAAIGEELAREREHNDAWDCYAVAVRRNKVIIGHSWFSSYICSQSSCSLERSLSTLLYNSFSSHSPGFARTGTRTCIIIPEIVYVLITCGWNTSCWKYFVLIFVVFGNYKNYLATKISQTTVHNFA